MAMRGSRLRIVILESPYDCWNSPQLTGLFCRVINLKRRGYQAQYPKAVLPIDTCDFIAFHQVVCLEQRDGKLKPVMAGKTTRLSTCDKHCISFPGLGLVMQAQSPQHITRVQEIMQRCRNEKKELGYFGSWTIDPTLPATSPIRGQLRQMFKGLYVLAHQHIQVDELIIGGTLRFKTEKLFAELGHEPMQDHIKSELPLIRVRHLFNEPVQLMHLQKYSRHALEMAERFQGMWENRLEISPTEFRNVQERSPLAA